MYRRTKTQRLLSKDTMRSEDDATSTIHTEELFDDSRYDYVVTVKCGRVYTQLHDENKVSTTMGRTAHDDHHGP